MKGQLSLLEPPQNEIVHISRPDLPPWHGLEGRELDAAWLQAGSPHPCPYNCVPIPFTA